MRTPRRQNMMGPKNQGSGEKAKDFKSAIKRLIKELSSLRGIIVFALILAIISAILSIAAPNKLSSITDVISEGLVINKENAEILAKTIQKNITKATEEMQAQLTIEIPAGFEMQNIDETNMDSDLSAMQKPELPEIEMNGIKVSSEDQYEFIEQMSLLDENTEISDIYGEIDSMPENIKELLKPTMNIEKIKKISIFLLGLYICSALFNYIQSLCMTDVANKFAKTLRTRISHKINKLPLKYFDKHQSGDILSRVTNDVDTIAQTMNNSLGMLVSSITLFIGSIIMMFWTNWIMALTAIISSLLGFAGMTYVLKKSQKYFDIRQIELGNLNGHIEEIYSGLNVVKAYNGQKECNKKFDYLNKKLKEANRKSQFLSGLMQPMMGFVGNFGYVAVCIVGALLAMNNHITFGVIVAFITYVRLFTNPLAQIAQAITSLQSTAAASERVFEFVDEKEMTDESNLKGKIEKTQAKGKIEFKNVVFQYEDTDKQTIKDFTATALPGQKIAIVGPTGAGKTTMVNLLMKFYEINSGDILIDGTSIKDLTRANIHDLFTMVLQDTWLFEGTIKENIVYNRKNITDEQVEAVCKEVGLDHFIQTLSGGYNAKISENDSISVGQRQLLTIARGMLDDAPFLILDEATSNVDTRTEELVQSAMDKLTEGKTSFIIAHRLSTIRNADLILVMKDGNIVEQGNHEELMKQNGHYAELYNSQFDKNE
ncbi:MAG: ABC transporter ATP-binding protein [Clostridia bacterium]